MKRCRVIWLFPLVLAVSASLWKVEAFWLPDSSPPRSLSSSSRRHSITLRGRDTTAVALSAVFGGFDLGSIFGQATDSNDRERQRLKSELLELCRRRRAGETKNNNTSVPPRRAAVQAVLDRLVPLSPVTETAASPLLQKEWLLEWTTEKEINLFVDLGWAAPRTITQTIDERGNLSNRIPLVGGGSFGVRGRCRADATSGGGVRTGFVFEGATLDLPRWGTYALPPVGRGWFDTVYLDDDLRVDVNSRDDILVCTPKETS